MAETVLGLDLGIASIGWALVKEEDNVRTLVRWGSRIFLPGMDDDITSGKGVSRCAERRAKRAERIKYRRRHQRKEQLISVLIAGGLLKERPDGNFFQRIDQKLLKSLPENVRKNAAHLTPYLFRKMALDRPLQPEEFARAVFHLAQRRGYLSNRKQEMKDEDSGVVKSGINQLKKAIADSGARTLGEFFCTVKPEEERIRNRYTERSMYQNEFRMMCNAQRKIVSEELEQELYKAIFYQRPLKSCKGLIGKCRVYPDQPRCSFAKEEAQLFRIYNTVRNLRVEKDGVIRSLTDGEHQKAVDFLNSFSPLFKKNGTIALAKLQKIVGLTKGEKFTLSDDEKEIYGNELKNILFRAFGERAEKLSPDDQKKFFNDIASIRKEDVLKKRLIEYWNLPEEQAEDVSGMSLPDDYCSFSLKALKELLPDLEAGINLNTILKLNHPVSDGRIFDRLPLVDECGLELRNPVVHRVLTELRKVINSIVQRYGKPDKIRVELARDLKATNKEREKTTKMNREREKLRAEIVSRIVKEAGIQNPSRTDILKVMLAEECNFECPYSGKSFNMHDLFSGLVEIEHIIPYSRSFDDSFSNKTLCVREYNARKGNRSPYEAFHGSKEYELMLARVAHFKGYAAERKLELFEKTEIDSEEFLSRNLNDTRYASKLAMQYLATLYGGIIDKNGIQRIFATSGNCTALIRRAWGGNYLLGEGEKVRSDHRHHAIDALTIALTTPALVKKIASFSPEQRKKIQESKEFVDNRLFRQAKDALEQVAVSHHQVNKMRGELHNATIYSRNFGGNERHIRVSLDKLDKKQLPDIVDKAIQKIILEKIGFPVPAGATEEQLKNILEKVSDKDLLIFKNMEDLPVMKDSHGNLVNTIKKVRIRSNKQTRTLGSGDREKNVANGENFVLAVFAVLDDRGNEIAWEGEIVSLLDAILRKNKGLPLFEKNKPGRKFKFSLQKGDIVTWDRDGKNRLCVIRGISLPKFSCVEVSEARKQDEIKAAKKWYQVSMSGAFKGNMKKFNMNIFGELQRAND